MPSAKTKTRARLVHRNTRETVAWNLRPHVAGQTPSSIRAFASLRVLREEPLQGRHQLAAADLSEHPRLPCGDQIIAVPTLIRRFPQPVRTIIGDLSDAVCLLVGLDPRKVD
jgi:circadian clock protein KaiB